MRLFIKKYCYLIFLPITALFLFINSERLTFIGSKSKALIGLYKGFPGRNGDHMYYVSMALQLSGKSFTSALTTTASIYQDYPKPIKDLLFGYLDPAFGPLIYPRQSLAALISWGYDIAGSSGIWLSTLVIGVLTTLLLVRWVWREWGAVAGLATLTIASASTFYIYYSTGLFIESILLLIEVLWLYTMPISRHYKSNVFFDLSNVVLIVLLGFTRQSPILPIAFVFAGWFATWIRIKRIRNIWSRTLILGSITSLLTYGATYFWAPYSPKILGEGFHPSIKKTLTYLATFAKDDPASLIIIVLAIFGCSIMKQKVLGWIALAAALSCGVNIFLATGEYRYWIPSAVPLLVSAGYGVAKLLNSISLGSIKKLHPVAYLTAISIFAVGVLVTSAIYYGKPDGSTIISAPVSAIYALKNPRGVVECDGPDLRIYAVDIGSKKVALDATAMSANPGIANPNSTSERKYSYVDLENFALKCMARSAR